jgi:hypothetical protein
MANVILCDPFPGGKDISSQVETFSGSVILAGSAVATGEPLNWANINTGIGYNEINRLGGGTHGDGAAFVTAFSASSGTVTETANNNFQVGQLLTFVGNTSVLGLLLNGVVVQVITATSTNFTFLSTATGTGTSEVGVAYSANSQVFPLQGGNGPVTGTVTALSASGGIVTVTAANFLLPGAQVVITSATSGIGATISGQTLTVIKSTGTAFTVTSSATGATGTGTFSGINPPQPFSVKFWSELASGYIYQYSRTTGVLFVMGVPAIASTPSTASALAALAAAAYPSLVLGDVIRYEAKFLKA